VAQLTKEIILKEFELFSIGTGGIGGWLTPDTDEVVFTRLSKIDKEPLTKVQFNQLLVLGHEAPVSDDFYDYYWLSCPNLHPYDVEKMPGFQSTWFNEHRHIVSLEHLKWGLYRLFTDGMLWFGNVRQAFRTLRNMSKEELNKFYLELRLDTERIKGRGPALSLNDIPKDHRYLISEMACKSYGDKQGSPGELKKALIQAYKDHQKSGGGTTTIKNLLSGKIITDRYVGMQQGFVFSADELLDQPVESQNDLEQRYESVAHHFFQARQSALVNTRYYLSMVSELDVYVATSMRTRQDFRNMASACETIFGDERLKQLQLRYFDPTLSAAEGHEDKGLIECLMVKCAKVLVYCAGEKESYGKDAEAAMALSQGKPVIFYCDHEQRSSFYRDVHPLSRLIDFKSGVAVGAMVTDSISDVSELLYRIFHNKMEYRLEQVKPGNIRLKEALTDSVVRLQSGDRLLSETFWNHYHGAFPKTSA